MITNGLFTRPHRLLLARFFSQGLVVAAIVTFAVGVVLTWLDRGNHVEHAADSAFERVARVAERIGHEMENMTLDKGDRRFGRRSRAGQNVGRAGSDRSDELRANGEPSHRP